MLTLVAALGLSILSYVEHTKNIRPSSIINAYLLLTLSFDVAQLRTKWLRGQDPAESGVASATLAVKLLLLVSEAIEKRAYYLHVMLVPHRRPPVGCILEAFSGG